MATYTSALTAGMAELIAGAGLATYRANGAYTTGENGITVGIVPDTPDRIVCLTPYPVEDGHLADAITAVQIRTRAGRDPRPLLDLSDALFNLLHNREHWQCGGIPIVLSWRQSEAWIGQDTKGRMERTANYYLRTSRGAAHLYE